MQKLERFVAGRTYNAVHAAGQAGLRPAFDAVSVYYKDEKSGKGGVKKETEKKAAARK